MEMHKNKNMVTQELTDDHIEVLGNVESRYKSLDGVVDVKCDKDNNSAEDMAKGIINVMIQFKNPVKYIDFDVNNGGDQLPCTKID